MPRNTDGNGAVSNECPFVHLHEIFIENPTVVPLKVISLSSYLEDLHRAVLTALWALGQSSARGALTTQTIA
jgi:hypothetical protein